LAGNRFRCAAGRDRSSAWVAAGLDDGRVAIKVNATLASTRMIESDPLIAVPPPCSPFEATTGEPFHNL
jgi:hypothetical protein